MCRQAVVSAAPRTGLGRLGSLRGGGRKRRRCGQGRTALNPGLAQNPRRRVQLLHDRACSGYVPARNSTHSSPVRPRHRPDTYNAKAPGEAVRAQVTLRLRASSISYAHHPARSSWPMRAVGPARRAVPTLRFFTQAPLSPPTPTSPPAISTPWILSPSWSWAVRPVLPRRSSCAPSPPSCPRAPSPGRSNITNLNSSSHAMRICAA